MKLPEKDSPPEVIAACSAVGNLAAKYENALEQNAQMRAALKQAVNYFAAFELSDAEKWLVQQMRVALGKEGGR